ncbi:MAG: alpha/beta hydrolase [Deltaproteobacteria bacterium]|nr:alpha/beta hydrolase [Deltaproteobacteria bacterium]
MRILLVGLLLTASTLAFADENELLRIDTRPGVRVSLYYMKRDGAPATVVLLPGGGGSLGLKGGIPTSQNFLVRSRDYFAANGFNVAVVNRPSGQALDYEFRISSEHIQDLRQVVRYIKRDTGLPVWLVGTSRGTISATAAAIAFGTEELAGIVLTASVTSPKKTGAVPAQNLEAIRIPVAVLHHEKDACAVTRPGEVSWIISGLKNAPVKKQIMVNGGDNPTGDPCQAMHWHGFFGMEKAAVDIIAGWIRNPKP